MSQNRINSNNKINVKIPIVHELCKSTVHVETSEVVKMAPSCKDYFPSFSILSQAHKVFDMIYASKKPSRPERLFDISIRSMDKCCNWNPSPVQKFSIALESPGHAFTANSQWWFNLAKFTLYDMLLLCMPCEPYICISGWMNANIMERDSTVACIRWFLSQLPTFYGAADTMYLKGTWTYSLLLLAVLPE